MTNVRGGADEHGTQLAPTHAWRRLRWTPGWLVAAVLAGVVLRVARWSDGKALNSDELWVALSLQRRSFLDLHGPLDYDQLAPLGWLWLERAVLAVSRSDTALRLPALLAGCAVVAVTAVLAHRLLPGPLAVAAVVLAAGAPVLIYQSSQLKQYSFEALACGWLVLAGLRILDAADRRRPVWVFWTSGAVAVWFATTALFVVASVGGLLALFALLDRRWGSLRRHIVAALPAVLSTLAVYLTAPPPAAWLYRWWSVAYPGSLAPRPIGVRTGLAWSAQLFLGFADSALGIASREAGILVLLLIAFGAVSLIARLPRPGMLVVAPLAAGYLLALLRLYPMATRVALWLVPIALLLLGAGADGCVRVCRQLLRRLPDGRFAATARTALPGAAAVLAVLVVLPYLGRAPGNTNADRYATAVQALRHLAANRKPGDLVLSHHGNSTSALVLWYGPGVGLRPDGEFATSTDVNCQPDADLTGASRVWLLRVPWLHPARARQEPERAAGERYGRLAEERWFGGVLVLRYDAPPGRPAPAGTPCLLSDPFRA